VKAVRRPPHGGNCEHTGHARVARLSPGSADGPEHALQTSRYTFLVLTPNGTLPPDADVEAGVAAELKPDPSAHEKSIFLQFYYPELKDLGKHFLTVVSGVLAFLVAFSEKVVNLASASDVQRLFLVMALALLMIAVVSVGTGVYLNFVAGGQANGSIIRGKPGDFKRFVRMTYLLYHIGGAAFVAALALLAAIAALKAT